MFLKTGIRNIMKNYYDKKDGYRETIQQGLIGAGSFDRNMSFGKTARDESLKMLKDEIQNADTIVVGAGAGLSTSAGLTYSGERFERYFFHSLLTKSNGRGGQDIYTSTDMLRRQYRFIKGCFLF
ncbi:hypothetical protein SAMN02910327_01390 [Peptostreptococcaceae bacterium pGA-8]|nr:hypothetical protein SAMN02910327_01390 [Peptostreptococcaceae bacterium pGA-8]